ncbi:Uncharacterised protein [Mycobacteroides abscessus subsp. abscessus]|nr:Uncharacterised protein [Mycobacteroides abscessus subsp. abscessus]
MIVENRKESHRGRRKYRIDSGIKVLDARGKDRGPGLFKNRVALLQRRARLQGHRDGAASSPVTNSKARWPSAGRSP